MTLAEIITTPETDRYTITGPHPDGKLWTVIDRNTGEEVGGYNAYSLAKDLCQRLSDQTPSPFEIAALPLPQADEDIYRSYLETRMAVARAFSA